MMVFESSWHPLYDEVARIPNCPSIWCIQPFFFFASIFVPPLKNFKETPLIF
jgi:hypothetical protein